MKNQIIRIDKIDKEKIKNEMEDKGYFVAEIDSEKFIDDKDFLIEISRIFKYPESVENFNWLDDVMTDLSWLGSDNGYVLFIRNAYSIVYPYPESAPYNFNKLLFWMYFWEDEVERVVVGGKKKKFDVYLVD